ncbi:Pectinacetylesterase [Macleaya cordata]|uniref:Pectin acetylesterase n=1 Tax=Macleaya cordata TaxID=56857 RepID=A0A200Q752_MACCD|nr:Pectinacetylesterase [Macleaya cordata]
MANSGGSRGIICWTKWGKKEWAVTATGFTILSFALIVTFDSSSSSWKKDSKPNQLMTTLNEDYPLVDLTLLRNAKHKGAVCLDGSSPGYHFKKGFGSGSNNWLLHIEGGGWCNTVASCSLRKLTALGSSHFMDHKVPFSGILSNEESQNPDFFNWNKVKIRYCDGASLSGNPDSERENSTKLFFRGQLVWEAVMDELLSLGLANARQALLSGCSAGGLATLIHCDGFREILPKEANVKCLADAGFFLDEKDVSGKPTMRSFYRDVFNLQVCFLYPFQCLFPEEIIKYIKTPVFLVNPAYDFWQIQHILAPDESDPDNNWRKCKLNIKNCNPRQIEILEGFRNSMLDTLSQFQQNRNGGIFINSCFSHCQTWMASTWHSANSPRINNKTIAEAVGDWYFDRKVGKFITAAAIGLKSGTSAPWRIGPAYSTLTF